MASLTQKSWFWHGLAILIPLVIMLALFPSFLTRPNDVLLGVEGDALKNSYTYLYQVKYGEGQHFEGMNYPYGENTIFTDNQPIISRTLAGLNKIFPIAENAMAWFNWILLINLVLAAFFLYRIFLLYGLPPWMAIWGGLIIAALSPQADRLDVHFSLGYLCFIPLTWWLTMMSWRHPEKKWVRSALVVNIFFQPFVHLYYLLINIVLVGSLSVFYFLKNRKDKIWATLRPLTITLVMSLVAIFLIKSIDPITDRPENPYGVETYLTSARSMLFPIKGPVNEVLKVKGIKWEGQGYMGVIALFVLPILFYKSFREWRHGREDKLPSRWMSLSLFSALLVFLYASGILNALGLKYVNELIPPLKQFRSLGRLAWISYYLAATTVVAYLFYLWSTWKNDPTRKKWLSLPILALLVYTWDGINQFDLRTRPWVKPNILAENEEVNQLKALLAEKDMKLDDFDALMGLPIVMLGPELIQVHRGQYLMNTLMPISFQSGLPIINWMMSRTSLSQALDFLELFTPDYVSKQRVTKMQDDQILVMVKEDGLHKYEQRIVEKSTLIGQVDDTQWHLLHPSDLFDEEKNTLRLEQAQRYASDTEPLVHYTFNDGNAPAYAGEAGGWVDGKETLWSGQIPSDCIHHLSFWIKLESDSERLPHIQFFKYGKDGQEMYATDYAFHEKAVAHNGWLRVEWHFDTTNPLDSFAVQCTSNGIAVDELLIHAADEEVFTESGGDWLFGNYLLGKGN